MSDPKIPQATSCLDDNALAALVGGQIDGEEARVARAHLDACDACHALAAAVARGFMSGAASDGVPSELRLDSAAAEVSRMLAHKRSRVRSGTRLGRYVVGEPIGAGGMGTVYAARDPELGRNVALKVVADAALGSEAHRKRLLREARAAAMLLDPNVVTIFDVGHDEGATYVAMELVEGRSLRAFVGDAAVPVEQRIAWLADIARALGVAHGRGLVHRDIKPENVMVRGDGVIKVVDFGIARRFELREDDAPDDGAPATVTDDDAVVGTLVYMAPEQLRGEPADARCDQFAWGVLAYELLAGERPWTGKGVSLVSQILSAELPALRLSGAGAIPPALEAAVRRATSKAPADRFASMADVVRALGPARGPAKGAGDPKRRAARLVSAIAAVLAASAAVAFPLVSMSEPKAERGAGVLPSTPAMSEPKAERGAGVLPSTPAARRAPPLETRVEPPATSSPSAREPAPLAAVPPPPRSASPDPPAPPVSTAPFAARPVAAAPRAPHASTSPRVPPPQPSAAGAPALSASAPPASCTPPFTWRSGVKVPKPECPLD